MWIILYKRYWARPSFWVYLWNNFKNNNRIILNNDELKEFLAKEGFKIIDLNKHSFIEQISLFNRAKIIISIHGSGLTNVIFSKPKTKIIEICSESSGNANKNLSIKCRLNHMKIIEKNLNTKLKYQNFHINVNISKLKNILANK